MQEFEKTKVINAEPDQVFEYLSDLNNLPQYLPTVQSAESVGGSRIRIKGAAAGKQYDETGFFRADRQGRKMEWGSDGDSGYSGWLRVEEKGAGSSGVTVHLSFDPRKPALREMDERAGDHQRVIEEGIEKALQSIKNQCEGLGGKSKTARR
jgi:uncharacterized membrane protein